MLSEVMDWIRFSSWSAWRTRLHYCVELWLI